MAVPINRWDYGLINFWCCIMTLCRCGNWCQREMPYLLTIAALAVTVSRLL
jgi:hypothetical protein